jgi:two-component system LytT family response regulator
MGVGNGVSSPYYYRPVSKHSFWIESMRTLIRSIVKNQMIPLKCNEGILHVDPEKISWIKSARNQVQLCFDGESCVLRNSLENIEEQLDGFDFVRIHKSTIVNVNHIRELRQLQSGTLRVFLLDGTQLLMSKDYWTPFLKHLRQQCR